MKTLLRCCDPLHPRYDAFYYATATTRKHPGTYALKKDYKEAYDASVKAHPEDWTQADVMRRLRRKGWRINVARQTTVCIKMSYASETKSLLAALIAEARKWERQHRHVRR